MGYKISWFFFYEYLCFSLVGRYMFVRKEVDMELRFLILVFLLRFNKIFNFLYNNCDLEIYGWVKILDILFLFESLRFIRLFFLRCSCCMLFGRILSYFKLGIVSMGVLKDREWELYLYMVIIFILYGLVFIRM